MLILANYLFIKKKREKSDPGRKQCMSTLLVAARDFSSAVHVSDCCSSWPSSEPCSSNVVSDPRREDNTDLEERDADGLKATIKTDVSFKKTEIQYGRV